MAKKAKPMDFKISLVKPDGVTVAGLKQYMHEAIMTWGGQNHPEDPLFYPWKKDSEIKITRIVCVHEWSRRRDGRWCSKCKRVELGKFPTGIYGSP